MSDQWEEKFSKKQDRKFWKHKETGETTWTAPAGLDSKKESKTTVAKADTTAVVEWDWDEKFSEKHQKKFWKNKTTGETTWKEPPKPVTSAATSSDKKESTETAAAAVEWDWDEKYSDKHKKKFWKNKTTGETTWKEPPKPAAEAPKPAASAYSSDHTAAMHEESSEEIEDPTWTKHFNKDKKKDYWKNTVTGQSTWTHPPKIKRERVAAPSTASSKSAMKKESVASSKTVTSSEESNAVSVYPCGFLYEQRRESHQGWRKVAAKVFTHSKEAVLMLYEQCRDCKFEEVTPLEKDMVSKKKQLPQSQEEETKDKKSKNGDEKNDSESSDTKETVTSASEECQLYSALFLSEFESISTNLEVPYCRCLFIHAISKTYVFFSL